MQGDADEGTPAEARRMADQLVAMMQKKGIALDYQPSSLSALDQVVDAIRATGLSETEASGMIYAVGCYLGEVMVRHAGAQWRTPAEVKWPGTTTWLLASLPDGNVYNPIGKAFKRFRNGVEDGLEFFYRTSLRMPDILKAPRFPLTDK